MPRAGLSGAAIAAIAVVLGVILLIILESRRGQAAIPSVSRAGNPDTQIISSPPPLQIPPQFLPAPRLQRDEQAFPLQSNAANPNPARVVIERIAPQSLPVNPVSTAVLQQPRSNGGPPLVFDYGTAVQVQSGNAQPRLEGVSNLASGDRVRASTLANRSTTVSQGTLMGAVLETALDSTSPGLARAIVSRDVYGFDGTRVLIPRGSRLVGEYGADTNPGQNRAIINWVRLIRPDGATIALDSPSTDTLGRSGVKADVNSHFFERFGSAILQSAISIGGNVAASRAGGTVILSLPGSQVNSTAPATETRRVVPTLKVKAGTSISVFVARDLDFGDVEPKE
jgi:type IV secretion system protein VirB10